jgi:branched-chain amino acid transport system permease protein
LSFLFAQFLTGLTTAASLFLIAAGLSLIFGVTRIVNFAHGAFAMLGAYLAYALTSRWAGGSLLYWSAILAAALIAGGVGAAVEMLLLRRIYRAPELLPLLATFALALIIEDSCLALWGPDAIMGRRVPGLAGAVDLWGRAFPTYDLALIVLGPAVLGALWLLLHGTRFGMLVRAATEDREMVGALGVRQSALFTAVFFLGTALAALGGALTLPRQAIDSHMDLGLVTDAFVVVVVGGLGSLPGAFLASLLLGELHAFGILLLPQITLVLTFLVMAVVLVLRPRGLLGAPETMPRPGAASAPPPILRPASRRERVGWLLLVAALAAAPFLLGDYALVILTGIVILALFAASLHFIMGPGGMISFGHAAYFGLGAYGAALLVLHFGAGMGPALLAAPLLAGAGALLFGWFAVRLSGVYLAMLTLAFAQIAWSAVFQWDSLTGGDNGILGIWPPPWAADKRVFYAIALALSGAFILALRHWIFAPFGYALRAGRDSPLRAEAIGIDIQRQQWLAFALAGTCAGVAGGLFAFAKGSVFPTIMSISTSLDALVMLLLGGFQTLAGPLLGAAIFTGLEAWISPLTDYWHALLGAIILAIVLLFPQGLLGSLRGWRAAEPGP